MIQIIGSILIIAASTWTGMLVARGYRNRPKEIRQWRSALQSIEAEIVFGRVPVADFTAHLSEQLPAPVNLFFKTLHTKMVLQDLPLQTAWVQAVEEFWAATSLRRAEKEVILQFGTTLGAEDTDHQKKHIQLALAHLEREEEEARAAQSANEKLMRSLGFLTGVLLVLLLI